ncbi:MAG: hypothetical protein KBC73_20440 [Burkholderiaceae bacterium]|nr:hypothetical protein [Burkholderiaceae bacterium]
MSLRLLCAATLAMAIASPVLAADAAKPAAKPAYLIVDHSVEAVMDKATAMAVWDSKFDDKLELRLKKLYPVMKWGFISQVEGGFTADKTCVVTARATMVPRAIKVLKFVPTKGATTFDAKTGLDQAGCKALAKAKLEEAIDSMTSSLVK